jgi:hypothetical protein
MAASKVEVYAALGVSVVALAVGATALVQGRGAPPPPVAACVDKEARATLDQVRRELTAADARAMSRLAMPPPFPSPPVPDATHAEAAPSAQAAAAPAASDNGGIRRYKHIETANPAVSVVQREDGNYDIKTTDPSLAGSVVVGRATMADGHVDQLFFHVPP